MSKDTDASGLTEYMSNIAKASGHEEVAVKPQHAFGQMIKLARKEKKITRKELADIVGVSINAIAKYERAGLSSGQYPPIPRLAKIIAATGLDARSLMAAATDDFQEQKAILGGALEPLGKVLGETNELMEAFAPHFFQALADTFSEGPGKELAEKMSSNINDEITERNKSSEDDLPSPLSSKPTTTLTKENDDGQPPD